MSLVFLVLLGAAVANGIFFGCQMAPIVGSGSNGGGFVGCISGAADNSVNTLSCEFVYSALTSTVTLAHFHVGASSTQSGNVTFNFANVGGLSSANGQVAQSWTATSVDWKQQFGITFDAQVIACASGTGCYFNLHTQNNQAGELRCELTTQIPTYSFTNVPLVLSPSSVNNAASTGTVNVWMAQIGNSTQHAWSWDISFSLVNALTNSHIHQGTSKTDNNGAVVVYIDPGTPRTTGKLLGIALEGTQLPFTNRWATYPAGFDSAIASHFCYVNLHTATNAAGEVRANISPSAASHVSLALLAIVFMIGSWMTM